MQVLTNTETITEKKLWRKVWTGCILAILNSNVNFLLSSHIINSTVEQQIFMSLKCLSLHCIKLSFIKFEVLLGQISFVLVLGIVF